VKGLQEGTKYLIRAVVKEKGGDANYKDAKNATFWTKSCEIESRLFIKKN